MSNPDWLIFFRGVETTNQYDILKLPRTEGCSWVTGYDGWIQRPIGWKPGRTLVLYQPASWTAPLGISWGLFLGDLQWISWNWSWNWSWNELTIWIYISKRLKYLACWLAVFFESTGSHHCSMQLLMWIIDVQMVVLGRISWESRWRKDLCTQVLPKSCHPHQSFVISAPSGND